MNRAHELDCLKEAHAWAQLFPWLAHVCFFIFFFLPFTGWQFQIPFTGQEFHYRDRMEQATTKSIIIKKTSESRRGNWRAKCAFLQVVVLRGRNVNPVNTLQCTAKYARCEQYSQQAFFYPFIILCFTPLLCQCKYMYYLKPFKG